MIIDIENKFSYLKVSYFTKDGDVDYINVNIPKEEQYVWEKCSPTFSGKDKEWKTWDNYPVKKVKSQKYDNYRIAQILFEADPELTAPLWEYQNPKKYFLDIEVEITEDVGAALDTASAKNRVLSIGIANSKKQLLVLGIDPLSQKQQANIDKKLQEYFKSTGDVWNFKYKQFETEYDMLYTFFKDIGSKMPSITGWNWLGYDWPYLINRCKRLGIDPNIISSTGYLKGKNQLPVHSLMFDYLEIYKKWDRVIKIKESNKLDYVANKSVGFKKIEYNGSLRDLYQSNFEDFIYYNAVDCALVFYIDEKLKTAQTFLMLGNISQVEINRVFSPVWTTEVMMLKELLKRKQLFIYSRNDDEHVKFPGAYVKSPIVGLHEWVACYDFASLYPNVMVQWGISPESYKGKNPSNIKDTWIKTSSGGYFGGEDEKPILRGIISDLYARRKKTKDEMLKLQIEIDKLQKQLEHN